MIHNIDYTKKNVQNILERFHHFESIKHKGNVDAIIISVDIKRAIKKCEFTEAQKKVFFFLFMREFSLTQVAEHLGMAKQTVSEHRNRIVDKVWKAINGRDAA